MTKDLYWSYQETRELCSGILCFRTQDWLLIPPGVKVLCQTYLITFIPSQGQALYKSQLNNNRNWSDFIILFIRSSVSFSLVFLVPVWMRKLETIQNKRKCFCFIQQIKKLRSLEVKVFSWVHTPFSVEKSGKATDSGSRLLIPSPALSTTSILLSRALMKYSVLSIYHLLLIHYLLTNICFISSLGLSVYMTCFVYRVTAKLQDKLGRIMHV